MLELVDVSKVQEGQVHIHPTSLTLQRGSLNVLLGPTLSGKTTLLRLMAGLEKPTSGSVRFDGKDVTGVAVQKRNVAMVYQQFINYPAMTVYENIASPLRVAGEASAVIDAEVKNDPAIYPPAEVSAKLFTLKAHTPDYDELLTETWQRIKAGS